MKAFLRRLLKSVAYLAAALVILLAVAVGLFRLMLPRLPAYQEEIKAWANTAIGLQVEFTGMDARWRLSGPELSFYNASLAVPDMENGVFSAEEVSVGVGLMRLLLDRTLVVDRLGIRDAELVVRRDDDGGWRIQGVRADELRRRFALPAERRDITVVAEDLTLDYQPADGTAPLAFAVDALKLSRTGPRIDAEAVVGLPDRLGNRVLLTAGQRPGRDPQASTFQLTVEGRGLKLAGLSALQPAALPRITAGNADVNLAFDWRDDRVTNATADVDIDGLATADTPGAFALAGRFEFENGADGWLVAAEDLRLDTAAGTWPSADLQVEAGTGTERTLRTLTASASYLNLADLAYLVPWMPDAWRAEARRFAPSGIVRDLALSLGNLQDEAPRYDIAMRLEHAGVLASDRWPGIAGFSGSLRANRSGGRVQIDAADMRLDLSRWLADPIDLTRAEGTVIWRRNRNGIIVLSDSVTLDSSELSSRSSLQVSLPTGGGSPVVDFESRWSISDISAARKYLPVNLIKPSLYRWLNSALVAGRATQGTTRFSGPLDKFPFDNDEGVFRIEASLEDATLRYSELWPDVENMDLELVVDRTRLYSDKNTAVSGGNSVVNAKIEIADLREPVLTIDAFASGTMQTIRQFARN
ncbi:MAG TPA: DUF3971 domain-containing protein, partial [Woeseiaceae bacterium]|nr:DUF3971 domain-containing protein [Woeseiaceae bacterium]